MNCFHCLLIEDKNHICCHPLLSSPLVALHCCLDGSCVMLWKFKGWKYTSGRNFKPSDRNRRDNLSHDGVQFSSLCSLEAQPLLIVSVSQPGTADSTNRRGKVFVCCVPLVRVRWPCLYILVVKAIAFYILCVIFFLIIDFHLGF